MIRFHTLGVLDLRDAEGQELRAVLQQPKRLGLLAYLAIATPRRFHRRDSLLALFWPELDQEHARAALRRALYFLRSELGAEVVAGRGDEEVGVPEAELWCDATALDQALAAADPAAALALYRGTLLDGLYVAGASTDLQDWLDRERLRLRDRAGAAAATLAAAAEREGRLGDAVAAARRGVELAADDEASLRRYLGLLDRAGEHSAALRAYDEFARRLAQDLELEPAAETRALADAMRARVERAPARAAGAARGFDHAAAWISATPGVERGIGGLGDLCGFSDVGGLGDIGGAHDVRGDDRRAAVRRPRRRAAGVSRAKGWSICWRRSSTARVTFGRSIPAHYCEHCNTTALKRAVPEARTRAAEMVRACRGPGDRAALRRRPLPLRHHRRGRRTAPRLGRALRARRHRRRERRGGRRR